MIGLVPEGLSLYREHAESKVRLVPHVIHAADELFSGLRKIPFSVHPADNTGRDTVLSDLKVRMNPNQQWARLPLPVRHKQSHLMSCHFG